MVETKIANVKDIFQIVFDPATNKYTVRWWDSGAAAWKKLEEWSANVQTLDTDIKLKKSIPGVSLHGTETGGKNLIVRENAGSVEFYDEAATTVRTKWSGADGRRITPLIMVGELADGCLTADATGRAKMADSFVVAAKILDGSIILSKLPDGVLTADVAGRAKMADSFVVAAKIGDGNVTLPKLPDGVLTANVAGRAKMADSFVVNEKVASDANIVATKIQTVLELSLILDAAGTTVTDPGTAYTEIVRCRNKVDFSLMKITSARVVVTAKGNEIGDGKGIEVYNVTDAASVCAVTWNGDGQQDALSGAWVAFAPTAEKVLSVRCKGASATEDLTNHSVKLQFK